MKRCTIRLQCALASLFIAALLIAGICSARADSSGPWVLIDTRALTLTVYSAAGTPLARFRNISLGRGGVAAVHLKGDRTTPLGRFRIAWIDSHSRFDLFFGLDYPTLSIAQDAYARHLIGKRDFDAVFDALLAGRLPPQNTALGGEIGIHGLGQGDPRIQRDLNWTDGCVALTNAQIHALARWIGIGTEVVIR
ncbi:MAG TPA: L,D-transpeptidase [Burkholderiales bacterium]|nr:L,D-transpeptidase [Burkholderiales bacterium]